jgi:DNA repair protein RadA/Sms
VKIALGGYDVYLNAVGGVRIGEPAADLAAALAIAGAAGDRTLPSGCVVFGELGLGGEVRRVRRSEQRLVEAAALGMQAAILPAAHTAAGPPGVRCHHVANLAEALRLLR